ncbi:MAG: uncharacterized DUF497 family protein [Spirosomataceae bacterium]|jgi:uncharacterized DUF497 family protein
MKRFEWNEEKNVELIASRGISFEDVLFHISNGDFLAELKHPNAEKYPNQKILVVRINGYVHYISFVEDDDKYFLKSIIPSRKLTEKYSDERKR